MRYLFVTAILVALAPAVFAESPTGEAKVIFNGENLEGWRGRSDLWAVVDGAIVATTTAENPLKGNTFLIFPFTKKRTGNHTIYHTAQIQSGIEHVLG